MTARPYQYLRQDFAPLPARLKHMDIYLSFHPEHVDAVATLHLKAAQRLSRLELDARDLEVSWVHWLAAPAHEGGSDMDFRVDAERAKLVIDLPQVLEPDQMFYVRTKTRCHPSDTLLEGIYQDVTPPGAPQQFISQCQQWGFQRIMPVIDDCRAKCTMTTTLEADAAYTHLISNGNIDAAKNPDRRPRRLESDPSRQVITFVNPVPMAPYLFIAAAGTWDELAEEVTYPSGKKVRLEYLVPPGRTDQARLPMEILKESVLWVARRLGYQYPHDTYRTICMTRSNFGGMENVGNTTIVTEAALIEPEHTVDATLLYAHAVIVHEFEHNQCGSQTTMLTPFDMWLNEAYTVDVERRFMAEMFDPAFVRLRQVDSMRDPLLGPLTMEDGGRVGRIVREGFNDPDELIDGVTYVKSAEVVGMLRRILGEEAFDKGVELYFSRYQNANADSNQFFACFQEVSGRSLEQFKQGWLYTVGYPQVSAQGAWDQASQTYRLVLEQETPSGLEPFHLPLAMALVDAQGQELAESVRTVEMTQARHEVVIDDVPAAPAFASLNRGASFYGSFHHQASADELAAQAESDPDLFSRVEAMRALTDRQRVRLMQEPETEVDGWWVELWGRLLGQSRLPAATAAYLLRIDEEPLDRAYIAWYPEKVAARKRLTHELRKAWREQMLARYRGLDTFHRPQHPAQGIEERLLRGVLLELITGDDSAQSQELAREQFERGVMAQDRVAALAVINRLSPPWRHEVLEEAYQAWHPSLNGYANYLRCVASGTQPDVFEQIAAQRRRDAFDITQPTLCRSLFLPMAFNTEMLWNAQGLAWLAATVIELAPVNVTTAGRLLNALQLAARLRPPLAAWAGEALENIVQGVTEARSPVLHRQARDYLAAARA